MSFPFVTSMEHEKSDDIKATMAPQGRIMKYGMPEAHPVIQQLLQSEAEQVSLLETWFQRHPKAIPHVLNTDRYRL